MKQSCVFSLAFQDDNILCAGKLTIEDGVPNFDELPNEAYHVFFPELNIQFKKMCGEFWLRADSFQTFTDWELLAHYYAIYMWKTHKLRDGESMKKLAQEVRSLSGPFASLFARLRQSDYNSLAEVTTLSLNFFLMDSLQSVTDDELLHNIISIICHMCAHTR